MMKKLEELSLVTVTWNVGAKSPKEDLTSLLGFGSGSNSSDLLPDVYVISFQELPLRPSTLLFQEPWVYVIESLLAKQGYVRVTDVRILGIMEVLFVKKSLVTYFRSIEVNWTRTGFRGWLGNKGGVGIRFNTLNGTSCCLVNCHLAAHDHKLDRRVDDYRDIVYGQQHFKNQATSNILAHDYVIIMGDLNFRINDLNSNEILERIEKATPDVITQLLLKDQLNIVRKEGRAFSEFSEQDVTFKPTYKYKAGTSNYDIKKRKPAFTDRILYRIKDDSTHQLKQAEYRAIESLTTSDHKPVSARFVLKLLHSDMIDGSEEEPALEMVIVKFDPIHEMIINNDSNKVTFRFSDAKGTSNRTIAARLDRSNDWIGILPSEFTSLDQWISYAWADDLREPVNQVNRQPIGGERAGGTFFEVLFPCLLTPNSSYRLVYFSGLSVLGISEPFVARFP